MRKSKKKIGFTKVDHITYDVILPQLSPVAQLVLLRVYRQTIGWGNWFDRIALSQFRLATGIKKNDTIMNAIAELEAISLKMTDDKAEATSGAILIPESEVNEPFDRDKLLVVLRHKTETPHYGLPYMMGESSKKLVELKWGERAQERIERQEKRRKKK